MRHKKLSRRWMVRPVTLLKTALAIPLTLLLVSCGNSANPMPTELDIPLDMDNRLREFFTICPIAMSDPEAGTKKAIAEGWDMDTSEYALKVNTDFNTSYGLVKDFDGEEYGLNISNYAYETFGGANCSMSSYFYSNDDHKSFDIRDVDQKFGFKGSIYTTEDGRTGAWELGSYPSSIVMYGDTSEDSVHISMSRSFPKTDPLYKK